ncbi:hypothetical protein NUW58_g2183 [Xylaria curta]|uniref:Uncharacterized protein n=1 Tax=Xylaria curta TaxID=42375 RepID=A0ACC1PGV0_9PEZI|nr:hypothetical protein NUW58_g2183 [Xylaria curta]
MTPIKGDYRGPHPFNCGKVLAADSTCHIAQFTCGRLDFPAHYLNLASFVFVKEAFSGLYNSFERVNTKGIVDQLAKDFGPSGDDGPLAALKTALGWLDGILGVVGLASWKRGAQQFFDLVGDVSEAGNLFADLYEQFAGEEADAKEKEMEAKDNIEDAVLLFKTTAQAGTENMLQYLFSGTEDGTNDLKRLIADGKFIEPLFGEVDDTATNATRRVEKLMQKRLIPAAWESDEDLKTVIIAYEDKKGDGGSHSPIHLWPWGPLTGEQENVAFGWLSDETASETRLEYREGGTNWVLWLLVYFNIENKSIDDLRWTFRVPNGFDKLGPDNKYYEGMRWQDLAISAFRGWIHADKDQGYGIVKEPSKADNPKEKGYFYEDDWRTPGFFSGIPICGLDVIHHAVQAEVYGRCETWPCCCSVAWNMPQVPCSKVPDGSPPFRTMEEAVLTQALADKKASQMRTGNLTLTSNDTISVNGTMVPSRKYSRGQLVPKEQV